MSTYEFISIIISSIGLLSTIGLIISLLLSVHDSKNSSKIKAAEAITYYIKSTSDETTLAVAIISDFSQEQCKSLYKREDLYVDECDLKLICSICPHKNSCRNLTKKKLCQKGNDKFLLQEDISYILRDHIIRYLNNLECVLLYWALGVVDKKTIEEELSFLKSKDSMYKGLEFIRKLAGGDESYPAIDRYFKSIDEKNKLSNKSINQNQTENTNPNPNLKE